MQLVRQGLPSCARRRLATLFVVAMAIFALGASPAAGIKYWVQRSHIAYKYGCSAYIYVNTLSSHDFVKVNSIWACRTDESSWTEAGHLYYSRSKARPFVAWMKYHAYGEYDLPWGTWVYAGEKPRYHVGWASGDNRHYFWYDNDIVRSEYISNMTSCWPNTNAEKQDVALYDNGGCFEYLLYKNYAWGSWSPWYGSKLWRDNDNFYKSVVQTTNHVDVVRGY